MKKTLAILAALLMLGACTKDLEMDFDDIEPQVVAMSCVEPDSTLMLRLTYSRFFLSDRPFRTIDDATASLTVNGTVTEEVVAAAGGNYGFAYRPQPGDRLDLRVSVPGRDAVSASTTVPHPASLANLRASLISHDQYDCTYSVRFTLDDPADEDNFYIIRVINHRHYSDEYGNHDRDAYCRFSCNDYLLTEGIDLGSLLDGDNPGEYYGGEFFFTDGNINGLSHEVELLCSTENEAPELYLVITSCSRDRYLYEFSTRSHDDDIFGEPMQVHCNIDGGIGIFAARSRSVLPIPLQQ